VRNEIFTVVGARPNFMKAAPIIKAIGEFNETAARQKRSNPSDRAPIQHTLVTPGSTMTEAMSDKFFADLNCPGGHHLGVGGGSHGAQNPRDLRKFEQVLIEQRRMS